MPNAQNHKMMTTMATGECVQPKRVAALICRLLFILRCCCCYCSLSLLLHLVCDVDELRINKCQPM